MFQQDQKELYQIISVAVFGIIMLSHADESTVTIELRRNCVATEQRSSWSIGLREFHPRQMLPSSIKKIKDG